MCVCVCVCVCACVCVCVCVCAGVVCVELNQAESLRNDLSKSYVQRVRHRKTSSRSPNTVFEGRLQAKAKIQMH